MSTQITTLFGVHGLNCLQRHDEDARFPTDRAAQQHTVKALTLYESHLVAIQNKAATLTDAELSAVFLSTGVPQRIASGQSITPQDWLDFGRHCVAAYITRTELEKQP